MFCTFCIVEVTDLFPSKKKLFEFDTWKLIYVDCVTNGISNGMRTVWNTIIEMVQQRNGCLD